jgi:hypothetical protein
MVVLTEQKWVARAIHALGRFKGRVLRRVLRDEILAHIADETQMEASEKTSEEDAGS